ncbi:MAG TPA: hypothetical protein VGX23_22470 [Actinocrinis sp.]|nr:hypothetical protein [Actinocrinis sp.]
MLYGILCMLMWILVKGHIATWVTIAGAMLMAMYYAFIRRNLDPGPAREDSRRPHRID